VTNGSLGTATCTQTVTVSEVAPSFRCADNLKATVNKDNNVRIRLTGIAGCADGCDYSVSGTGSDATVYTGCTNTNCTIPAITNKSKNKGDTAIYTVTLTNTAGSIPHNCSVEFIEGATCHCEDYCSSGCKNLQVAGSGFNDASPHCLFITGARVIRLTGRDVNGTRTYNTKINGVSLTGETKCENATACETLLSNYTKQDGGYYIWLDSWNYAHLEGATGTSVCSIGSDGPIEVEKQESFAVNTTGVEVTIKGSESPSGCQIQCSVSGNPGNVSVYIGNTEVASGNNSAGNNINASYCAGGAKWTVKASNVAVTSCYFNWW
jgi:hypothetical protein